MGNQRLFYIPGIPYIRLRHQLRTRQVGELPAFKGSVLRGAFGNALRKSVCVMGAKQLCRNCFLNRQCVNTRLFETLILDEPPRFLKGLPTSPRPFVLYCSEERRGFTPETPLVFEMSLFGTAVELFPFVIFAVQTMAQRGLGSRRLKFHLEEVAFLDEANEWQRLYDGATRKLVANPTILNTVTQTNLTPGKQKPSSNQQSTTPQQVTLRFISPLRIKINRELSSEFTFRELLFKMLRRNLELAYFYVPDAEIDWEFHDLLTAADHIEIIDRELRWIDLHRYSSRQKSEMKLGGFVGHITLQGNLAPFMPLLHACEVLHIGKATTFGLGRVEVEDYQ